MPQLRSRQLADSVPASDVPTSQMGRSTTPCGTLHNLSGEKKKDYSPAVGRAPYNKPCRRQGGNYKPCRIRSTKIGTVRWHY